MGAETGRDEERPTHIVFTDAFLMDVCPVTNRLFKAFLKACPQWQRSVGVKKYLNTYYLYLWREDVIFPNGKRDHPVVYVNWYSTAAYCNWRSREEGLLPCYDEADNFTCDFSASGYRLPTEAEYERASRGGMEQAAYPWGDSIDKSKGNYNNLIGDTTEAGIYLANGYGLFDMSGNIGHWCQDWFDPDYYHNSPVKNPRGPETGKYRVYRGGAWGAPVDSQRCASRFWLLPENCNPDFGFRCVRAV